MVAGVADAPKMYLAGLPGTRRRRRVVANVTTPTVTTKRSVLDETPRAREARFGKCIRSPRRLGGPGTFAAGGVVECSLGRLISESVVVRISSSPAAMAAGEEDRHSLFPAVPPTGKWQATK
jgi:hypothetical protein